MEVVRDGILLCKQHIQSAQISLDSASDALYFMARRRR